MDTLCNVSPSDSAGGNEYDKLPTSEDIVGRYARYGEILSWQMRLAALHSDFVKLVDIGLTYEGRPMKVLKIGIDTQHDNKWSVWIDGGIHAREHVTPSSVIYIADQLVRSYYVDEAKWVLQYIDWYMLPVINPDGYEYSFTKEGRNWRKNRRPVGKNCTGVDLNRNWDISWGGADSDRDPCSEQYMGDRPESEIEVSNIVEFLLSRSDQFIAFVTLHSFGERILSRWDHTANSQPDDHQHLMYVANKMALAMQQPYDTEYSPGVSSQIAYLFAGGSADWARAVANIRYSYLVELRDSGNHGFHLPVDQILPTGCEAWVGVRELAAHALLNDGFTRPAPSPCDSQPDHVTSCRNREPASLAVQGELLSLYERVATSTSHSLSIDTPCFVMTSSLIVLATIDRLLTER